MVVNPGRGRWFIAVECVFLREFEPLHAYFLIGGLIHHEALREALKSSLNQQTYESHIEPSIEAFFAWAWRNRHRVDCLVLEFSPDLQPPLEQLKNQDILLPVLLVETAIADAPAPDQPLPVQVSSACEALAASYHDRAICILQSDLKQLDNYIQQAINQFLTLPYGRSSNATITPPDAENVSFTLSLQQQRLAAKLRERLGYVGVFYKRDPSNFVRNLDAEQRQALFEQLKKDYRLLVLSYFKNDAQLNDRIDALVNTLFFADVSVSRIVEIHMELMETFAKQLKLEGRSEEILLDYRLTLIDVIAHLCEMYRRAIPRERLQQQRSE